MNTIAKLSLIALTTASLAKACTPQSAFAQLQIDPLNKNTFSYQLLNQTSGQLSFQHIIPQLNVENSSTATIHAPGFSYATVIPGGTSLLNDLHFINTALGNTTTQKLINQTIHLLPKSDQKIVTTVEKDGTLLLKTLGNILSPSPSPSPFYFPSPLPSPLPTYPPTPLPAPAELPTPAPSAPSSADPAPVYSNPSPVTESPTSPSSLQVVDLLACPSTGQPQWIKLFNPDAQAYTLNKWHLYNSHNRRRVVNATIQPRSELTIEFKNHFFLKAGDRITLMRPDGSIVFVVDTPACSKKKSSSSPTTFPQQDTSSSTQQTYQYTPPTLTPTTENENVLPSTPNADTAQSTTVADDSSVPDQTPIDTILGDTSVLDDSSTSSYLASSSPTSTSSPTLSTPTAPLPPERPPVWGYFFLALGAVGLICTLGCATYFAYNYYQRKK